MKSIWADEVECGDDGPVVQLPFSFVHFSLFPTMPVCIDSIDKHSPGGPAESASTHLILPTPDGP